MRTSLHLLGPSFGSNRGAYRGIAVGAALIFLAGILVAATRGSSCAAFAMTVGSTRSPTDGEGTPRINVVLTDAHLHVVKQLTDDGTSNEAAFSPDGRRIAYVSGRGFANEADVGRSGARVRVMNADGTHDHQVSDGYDIDPAWSPDGTKLVFIRVAQPANLWTVDLRTGRQAEIPGTQTLESDFSPKWLSTGRILFADRRGIESVTPSGGPPSLVTAVADDHRPVFNADGSRYAVIPAQHGDPIPVTDVSTGASIDIPRSGTQIAEPLAWTNQGRIVFTQNVSGADVNVVIWRPGDARPRLVRRVSGLPLDLADNPACAP